jgi:regulator of protease activity HflC (stomatin/prohibitin superfamily)
MIDANTFVGTTRALIGGTYQPDDVKLTLSPEVKRVNWFSHDDTAQINDTGTLTAIASDVFERQMKAAAAKKQAEQRAEALAAVERQRQAAKQEEAARLLAAEQAAQRQPREDAQATTISNAADAHLYHCEARGLGDAGGWGEGTDYEAAVGAALDRCNELTQLCSVTFCR